MASGKRRYARCTCVRSQAINRSDYPRGSDIFGIFRGDSLSLSEFGAFAFEDERRFGIDSAVVGGAASMVLDIVWVGLPPHLLA